MKYLPIFDISGLIVYGNFCRKFTLYAPFIGLRVVIQWRCFLLGEQILGDLDMKKIWDYIVLILLLLALSAVLSLLGPIFELLWSIGKQLIVQHHIVWKSTLMDYLISYLFAVVIIFIGLVIDVLKDGLLADYLDFRKKKRNGETE